MMEDDESDEQRRYKEYCRDDDRCAVCRALRRQRRFGLRRYGASLGLQSRLNVRQRTAPFGIKMKTFARDAAEWLWNRWRRSGIGVRPAAGRCFFEGYILR
jgi:hypothetical protein